MPSYKEFLEDYARKEDEEAHIFYDRIANGQVSKDDMLPGKDRFVKICEPIAIAEAVPVWSMVPFYGSTLVPLYSSYNKREFDLKHDIMLGFSSHNLDRMIDFSKETGRLQFVLFGNPIEYANLDFLEPLLRELRPPVARSFMPTYLDHRKYEQYRREFLTLISVNKTLLKYTKFERRMTYDREYIERNLDGMASVYIGLKGLGYDQLADELGNLVLSAPEEAYEWIVLLGNMIVTPSFSPLKCIRNYQRKHLDVLSDIVKKNRSAMPTTPSGRYAITDDIGKFILEKLTYYPSTMDGCMNIIQHYDDYELRQVLQALNKGVTESRVDVVEQRRDELSKILDNIWNDSDTKIRRNADVVRLCIALVGLLSVPISGIGLLATMGISVADKIIGMHTDAIGEKIAKSLAPDYLVGIHDFKQKHRPIR